VVLLCICFLCIEVNASKAENYKRRSNERRSLFGKKNHMFSCIRNMKYWNGVSCEDFTEKTCAYKNYYWDKTKNKCFFTAESACKIKNMYWTGTSCIKYTRDTCLEQHMIWNSIDNTCDYQQEDIQYIDLNNQS